MSFWIGAGLAFLGLWTAMRPKKKGPTATKPEEPSGTPESRIPMEDDGLAGSDAPEAAPGPDSVRPSRSNPFRTRKVEVPPSGWRGGSLDDVIDGGSNGEYDPDEEYPDEDDGEEEEEA